LINNGLSRIHKKYFPYQAGMVAIRCLTEKWENFSKFLVKLSTLRRFGFVYIESISLADCKKYSGWNIHMVWKRVHSTVPGRRKTRCSATLSTEATVHWSVGGKRRGIQPGLFLPVYCGLFCGRSDKIGM